MEKQTVSRGDRYTAAIDAFLAVLDDEINMYERLADSDIMPESTKSYARAAAAVLRRARTTLKYKLEAYRCY